MYCSFANIWPTVTSNCLQSPHLPSVSVCNIFVAWYLVYTAWSCAAIISLSVFSFRSPLDNQRNVSASLIICLSILVIYWPCITLLSNFFFKNYPNFAFMCWMPFFFASLFSFDWFNYSATFAAALIVEFLFDWLLSWLLTTFTNWPSIYSVFKYSAVLIISALYVASVCNRPLPPPFLSTYIL